MLYRTLIAVSALLLLLLCTARAAACSCAGPNSPCQDYGRAAAVFVGTAITVKTVAPSADAGKGELDWAHRVFKFSVEESFLSAFGSEIEVSTGRGGGDCGYDFKIGERYVVYAFASPKTDRLLTSICTRTRPSDKADEDLEFLRKLGSMSGGVTIYGEVKRGRQRVAAGDVITNTPMADANLTVVGVGQNREIRTDADGRYAVTGLPPGKYKVSLVLPDELFTHRPEQEVTIANRGCAAVSYHVVDNGRVSGTVFDPDGQPAARVLLALMEAEHLDVKKDYSRLERTDEQGSYSFSALPAGRYILAVNMNRFPEPTDVTNAYPRSYYPGATDISKAEVITLGTGRNLTGYDFRLPTRRAESTIDGKSSGMMVARFQMRRSHFATSLIMTQK